MAAESSPGRGSSVDCTDCPTPVEKSGLRVLAIYKGSDVYVASRPGYFRRITPQVTAERNLMPAHPNQTRETSGE